MKTEPIPLRSGKRIKVGWKRGKLGLPTGSKRWWGERSGAANQKSEASSTQVS